MQVYFNSSRGVVGKLSYQGRGPFQIKEIIDTNSYLVHRYTDEEGPTRKYKGTELYILPPNLFPCEPMDTMDERYINSDHAPMVSPLHRPLKIELYNDMYFSPSSNKLVKSTVGEPSCLVDAQMNNKTLS